MEGKIQQEYFAQTRNKKHEISAGQAKQIQMTEIQITRAINCGAKVKGDPAQRTPAYWVPVYAGTYAGSPFSRGCGIRTGGD